MRTWPVDFSGFTDVQAITERLEYLQTRVWRGHEDICWASWEVEQLNSILLDMQCSSPLIANCSHRVMLGND